jgi:anaerobic selenocysteine-containing dehydrogenase
VELSVRDAEQHDVAEGDLVEVTAPRGSIRGRARITGIREGVVFVPFHYGYWDSDDDLHDRAANEVTITEWDPASKQPIYKTAACRVQRIAPSEGEPAPAPTTGASAPVHPLAPTTGGPRADATEEIGP